MGGRITKKNVGGVKEWLNTTVTIHGDCLAPIGGPKIVEEKKGTMTESCGCELKTKTKSRYHRGIQSDLATAS